MVLNKQYKCTLIIITADFTIKLIFGSLFQLLNSYLQISFKIGSVRELFTLHHTFQFFSHITPTDKSTLKILC